MKSIVDYKDLREALLNFKKKKYFEEFTSSDLFYVLDTKGRKVVLSIITQFFGDSYGIQMYHTRDGRNYVHDVLSATNYGSVTQGDCDSIVAVLKPKDQLTEEDIAFLESYGQKKLKDNLIIYRFEKGMLYHIASGKDIALASLYTVFMDSLLTNEHEDILEAFKEESNVLVSLNLEELSYTAIYQPLPFIEDMPKKSPANMPFVLDYKDKEYCNSDCFLFCNYLPVCISETKVRPLLLYFYYEKMDKSVLKYFTCLPKDYKNCIYGVLDDVFAQFGMPVSLTTNSRDMYILLSKTLDALKIENSFNRNLLEGGDDVGDMMCDVYNRVEGLTELPEEIVMDCLEMISSYQYFTEPDEDDFEIETNDEDFFVS